MNKYNSMGQVAWEAKEDMLSLSYNKKVEALNLVADYLVKNATFILEQNRIDLDNAYAAGMKESLIDRLSLTLERIEDIASGIRQVADLDEKIGNMQDVKIRPNGLKVGKMVVPLGVVGVIYESRPNVTADVFALCFKTSNVVILKGGSDAINSNKAIVAMIKAALDESGINNNCINLIEDTDRESLKEFMKLDEYVDVLIPRGGKGLIDTVKRNSTIPVIETGTGNCHIYVDESADVDMAVSIIDNAKTQRLGVCNAAESLVLHKSVVERVMPKLVDVLTEKEVELRVDESMYDYISDIAKEKQSYIKKATDEDYYTEYLDRIISIKVVENIDEAIKHINKCSTKHSESIITSDYNNANKFHKLIDSAAVYVNASTRFTDGFEYGFGAEIGISTQKLHARGPMGLDALTCNKYVIFGEGQVRK
ncbi:MAG: glutamate-5-semialdehyde dehydrogenase [Lachnospiraceae bacterium]|nr:glutamate-5-semialdehyde dehydrogenase [Lachnospiraceae bacterium]